MTSDYRDPDGATTAPSATDATQAAAVLEAFLDDPGATRWPTRLTTSTRTLLDRLRQVEQQRTTAVAIIARVTHQMNEYDRHGAAGVNPRQVLNLLSPTWPDGNYSDDRGGPDFTDPATPAVGCPPTGPADFFQPGHTYIEAKPFMAPEGLTVFHCVGAGRFPDDTEQAGPFLAFGFATPAHPGDRWNAFFCNDAAWGDGWSEYDMTPGAGRG